jgi:predicted nucleic acid-binding protein
VPERPIVDASPLILLTRAGRLDLLRQADERIVVPRAVADEILAYGGDDPTASALREADWIDVVDVTVIPLEVSRWELGPGESEVLAWALQHAGTEAIVDDLDARRCAATLGVPVRGTLGLVLLAKRRGRIAAAAPVLDQLQAAGMYLSDAVVRQALALVDE